MLYPEVVDIYFFLVKSMKKHFCLEIQALFAT